MRAHVATFPIVLVVAACSLSFDSAEFGSAPPRPLDGGVLDGATGDVASAVDAAPGPLPSPSPLPPSPPTFVDAFERPSSELLGNGWVEENQQAFQILDGKVKFALDNTDREVAKVTRPASEALVDVRATVEFTLQRVEVQAEIFVRVEPPVVAGNPGYRLEITGSAETALYREFGFRLPFALSQPIALGDPVRMILVAAQVDSPTGAVRITGSIVRVADNRVLGSAEYVDQSPERLTKPGVVGFSDDSCCGKPPGDLFDNFAYGPP